MDFRLILQTVRVEGDGAAPQPGKRPVQLPLRRLTRDEARQAVRPWIDATGSRKEPRLFGRGASKSWTVAVISELKDMAQEISPGKLRWLLGTAMPLRDDFRLYLNNERAP